MDEYLFSFLERKKKEEEELIIMGTKPDEQHLLNK